MLEALSESAISAELVKRPQWTYDGTVITRTYDCGDFVGSIAFVNAVAAAANAADHHPDLAIAWNRVTVNLSTHDAGGITALDFALAATIDELPAGGRSSG